MGDFKGFPLITGTSFRVDSEAEKTRSPLRTQGEEGVNRVMPGGERSPFPGQGKLEEDRQKYSSGREMEENRDAHSFDDIRIKA